MANNRMWLVNQKDGSRVLLAKYYPSTGWYVSRPERLDEAFNIDDFGQPEWTPNMKSVNGSLGGNHWAIEYEEPDSATGAP